MAKNINWLKANNIIGVEAMSEDKYAYFHERQALTDRLAKLSWEMARVWKEYEHFKGMQDTVLKQLAELDKEIDYIPQDFATCNECWGKA